MRNKIINLKQANLPQLNIDPNVDHYFFPFFVSGGADSLAENFTFNNLVKELFFAGKTNLIIEPVGWEKELSAVDSQGVKQELKDLTKTSKWFRNVAINNQFLSIGKILNLAYFNKFSKLKSFTKIETESNLKVFFNDGKIWDHKLKTVKVAMLSWFFYAPEVNNQDILFIKSIEVNLFNGEYHSHVISFASLGQQLSATGRTLLQKVQFGSLGDAYLMPKVAPIQVKKNDLNTFNETEFYINDQNWLDVKGTKKVYLDKIGIKTKGVTSLQIAFKGSVGLISIRVVGRPRNSNWKIIERPRLLLIRKFNVPIISSIHESQEFEKQYVISTACQGSILNWFDDWKQEQLIKFDPRAKRQTEGVLQFAVNNASNKPQQIGNKGTVIDTIYQKNKEASLWDNNLEMGAFAQNNKLTIYGRNNLLRSPFSDYLKDIESQKRDYKTLDNAYNLTYSRMTDFINFNGFLQDGIQFLEMGQKTLFNKRGYVQAYLGLTLGLLGGILGKVIGGKSLGVGVGLFAGSQASKVMNFLPSHWFTDQQIIKWANKFNMLLSQEIASLLSVMYPTDKTGYISNNEFTGKRNIPLQVFATDQNSQFTGFGDVNKVNNVFHFDITDLLNSGKNTLTIRTGETKIKVVSDLKTNAINHDFAIDLIEIKAVGQTDFNLTAYNLGEQIYFSSHMTQSKFSNNLREITTSIFLSNFIDNEIGKRTIFQDSILRKQNAKNWPQPDLTLNEQIAKWRTISLINYDDETSYSSSILASNVLPLKFTKTLGSDQKYLVDINLFSIEKANFENSKIKIHLTAGFNQYSVQYDEIEYGEVSGTGLTQQSKVVTKTTILKGMKVIQNGKTYIYSWDVVFEQFNVIYPSTINHVRHIGNLKYGINTEIKRYQLINNKVWPHLYQYGYDPKTTNEKIFINASWEWKQNRISTQQQDIELTWIKLEFSKQGHFQVIENDIVNCNAEVKYL